jgi:DNA-binding NarL/FixJ family response regulator
MGLIDATINTVRRISSELRPGILNDLGLVAATEWQAQQEVMRLIASGKTVSEIAELLSLSDKTISTYRTRILEKMDMKTNAELTHYAIKSRFSRLRKEQNLTPICQHVRAYPC